jgi:hypothetical protein
MLFCSSVIDLMLPGDLLFQIVPDGVKALILAWITTV